MVNETIEIAANILDFNLDTLTQQTKSAEPKNSAEVLQRSCSKTSCTNKQQPQLPQQQQPDQRQEDQLNASSYTHLASKSTENLSWKFFEDVSTLDNQLRGVDELSVTQSNGCNLIITSPTPTPTHQQASATTKAPKFDGIVDGQPQEPIIRSHGNNNGCVASATVNSLFSDALLSQTQQSPDVIQQHQQLQVQQSSTFQFTSPTSTFKRKKLQQQQKSLNCQHHNSINNTHNNHNSLTIPTTSATNLQLQLPANVYGPAQTPEQQQQSFTPPTGGTEQTLTPPAATKPYQNHQQHQQQYVVSATMIGSGTGAYNTAATTSRVPPAGAGGSILGIGPGSSSSGGTTRSGKVRTLPVITTTTAASPRQAYAADSVDLVGGHTHKPSLTFAADGGTEKRAPTASHRMAADTGAEATQHSHSNTNSSSSSHNNNNNYQQNIAGNKLMDSIGLHLGLSGWRKKCLYVLLALLMLLIVTNLMLTLWILKVMEFSTDGMGQLKIVPGGIQLTGQALIMDMLRASTIRSRHGQPIAIESSRNFSINTRDTNGMLENHLFLGHDKLECLATSFRINDTTGRNLFSVNRNEVTIGAHALRIDGEGGAVFRESVQTPHVRAEPGRELRLESPTRQLELTAARDINLQSRAGGIELSALKDVRLSAMDGSLRLESSKILMPNLRTAQPPLPGAPQSRDHMHRVFQLCACSNGKLFLAAPHSICAGDDSTVCR